MKCSKCDWLNYKFVMWHQKVFNKKKIKYKTLKLYLKTKSLPKHINFEKIHLSKFK